MELIDRKFQRYEVFLTKATLNHQLEKTHCKNEGGKVKRIIESRIRKRSN